MQLMSAPNKSPKRMRGKIVLLVSLLLATFASFAGDSRHNVVPKDGYVPNAETAISIAVAVWVPIYGADNIARQKPYRATLGANGVWTVTGAPPKELGGVAIAEIAKADGRILRVSHGK